MGRRKLEMKRIEDKSSRQVTFSKRRSGLFKKAHHLSILCDVDIAVFVISAHGKLYEFSSDGTGCSNNSVEHIFSRYQKSLLQTKESTSKSVANDLQFLLQCKRFRPCKELLQTVDRLVEENNTEELSVTDMTQLEIELDDALVQTRLRKTQLMTEYLSTLQEEVASAKQNGPAAVVSDGGGGVNDLATNQMNSPQLVPTLLLFDG
uniref:agamous-like MADS-box protein AGL27 isoform X3 n=1 Tax=Erigeron canadensis TaxID=72917 RepID=UPI001CB90ADC|nr:agamous-like MADS-box protein AGL27 isoform X3 [Erigeron canadensis]